MKFKILKNKEKNSNLSSDINEKTREKSTGRSMVEMLGVLAIIGVLSIGGIQGYTIAMRKYRANEIVNTLIKAVNIVYMDFYNYRLNNPCDARVDLSFGDYYPYLCHGSNYVCPYYHVHLLADLGLGNNPEGVSQISTWGVIAADDDNPTERVELGIYFTDKKLCEAVDSLLSVYENRYKDDAGCENRNKLVKNIPIDFSSTYRYDSNDGLNCPDINPSSYEPDNSYDSDYSDYSDNSYSTDW